MNHVTHVTRVKAQTCGKHRLPAMAKLDVKCFIEGGLAGGSTGDCGDVPLLNGLLALLRAFGLAD